LQLNNTNHLYHAVLMTIQMNRHHTQ
jgi:hypothetical protein